MRIHKVKQGKANWTRWLKRAMLRQLPRRKKMLGGFLHKILGERVFDKRLWKPDRMTVAGGLALGLAIGLLPTYYIQILLSLIFSYLLRVNVSATVVGTLVTNPLTTAPILYLQYQLGILLMGPPDPDTLNQFDGIWKLFLGHGMPYLVGSIVSAISFGVIGYLAVLVFWDMAARLKKLREERN